MTRGMDVEKWRDELVDACAWGEDARARALVSRLGAQPRKARALLETMLNEPDVQVRQAAVFALGELGGAASASRLEQQLSLEEARGDHDGSSVADAITLALGRIGEASARASLVRRLERLAAGKQDPGDVNTVALSLWRRRHPDLLPAIRRNLDRFAPRVSSDLHALLVLLEKTPGELCTWLRDPSIPLEHKTSATAVLEEELPETLLSTLPAFISEASALAGTAVAQRGEASYFCERLLSFVLSHREQILASLPQESRSELRALARRLVASVALNCSSRAVLLLQLIGEPEDLAP